MGKDNRRRPREFDVYVVERVPSWCTLENFGLFVCAVLTFMIPFSSLYFVFGFKGCDKKVDMKLLITVMIQVCIAIGTPVCFIVWTCKLKMKFKELKWSAIACAVLNTIGFIVGLVFYLIQDCKHPNEAIRFFGSSGVIFGNIALQMLFIFCLARKRPEE